MMSSPFLRCAQTAMCIAGVFNIASVGLHNGLCEFLSPTCGIRKAPDVPTRNRRDYYVKMHDLSLAPLPDYPEDARAASYR